MGSDMYIFGVLIALINLPLALWPHRQVHSVEARIAEGGDQFFEEQRAYQAYPWMRNPKRIRLFGVFGVIGGIAICVLTFFHP